MASLWPTLVELLRLKAGPQDLPVDRTLTVIAIAIYLGQAIMTNQALGSENEPARSIASIALQFGLIAAVLFWRRRPERLQQTLLAFALTGTVVGLLAFFLLLQNDPAVASQPVLALVWFAIFGWSLAIDANIFRHALNVTLPIGMLITVMLLAITYIVLELMFP